MFLIPTKENLNAAKQIRANMLTWHIVYDLISHEFERFKKNTDMRELAYKIELVNKLFNCNLRVNKGSVAEELIKIKIDTQINSVDPVVLVNKIADLLKKKFKRRHLVFASKYCHFHQPKRFPMYDNFARRGLSHLFGKKFKEYEKNYGKFKIDLDKILLAIESKFGWQSNYKELDEYLWIYGQWLVYKENKKKKDKDKKKRINVEIKKNISQIKGLFLKLDP